MFSTDPPHQWDAGGTSRPRKRKGHPCTRQLAEIGLTCLPCVGSRSPTEAWDGVESFQHDVVGDRNRRCGTHAMDGCAVAGGEAFCLSSVCLPKEWGSGAAHAVWELMPLVAETGATYLGQIRSLDKLDRRAGDDLVECRDSWRDL